MSLVADNAPINCQRLRTLRLALVATLLLYAPVVVGLGALSFKLVGSGFLGFAAAGFLMAVFVGCFLGIAFWKCPKCGNRFARFNIFWPTRCHHCGLHCQ